MSMKSAGLAFMILLMAWLTSTLQPGNQWPKSEWRLCDTLTVSGVTHRSYFQRDLLISTVVTFGHPRTGYYRL